MKKDFLDEVDSKNMDIAKRIVEDSENLKADNIFDGNLMTNIENKRELKKRNYKKVFEWGTSIAACITILAVVGVLWSNSVYRTDDNKMNKSESYQEDREMKSSYKSDSNTVSVAEDYSQIYEKMKYVGNLAYGEVAEGTVYDGKTSGTSLGSAKKMNTKSAENVSEQGFYDTNEQTEGVHEADVVKTDGNYIYTLKCTDTVVHNVDYEIFITKAEGKNLENVSKIKIKNKKDYLYYIRELYVEGDTLIAVGTRESRKSSEDDYMTGCYAYNRDMETVIFTYDISDRSRPFLISENIQEGSYINSRLSNEFLYTISDKYMGKITKDVCVPRVNGKCVSPKDVYLPERINDREYTVITVLDIRNAKKYTKTVAVAGTASTIYVSSNHIYVIEHTREEEDITNTKKGKAILKKSFMDIYENEEYSLTKEEKKYVKDTYEDVKDVSARIHTMACKVTDSIHILKYSYDKENVEFVAEQTVKGSAGDNMLFDEKDGYLRFVTTEQTDFEISTKINYYDQNHKFIRSMETEGEYIDTTEETNNLFVLDKELNVKAQINGLAEKESVYAARYLGDYGYFVTYENTDPLFTVDFSDIENPKIIGELKMPGYSQYLHFYTENKLFGIGMDTEEKTGEEKGLKIEMYNVSKKAAKCETKNVLRDVQYSDALDDYKALMIDSKKGIIGFPGEKNYYEENIESCYYLYTYKNGEFKELASINLKQYYNNIRGFYINDYVYIVVPNQKILALSMDNYKVVGSVELKMKN